MKYILLSMKTKLGQLLLHRVVKAKKSKAIKLVDYAGSNNDIYLLTENFINCYKLKMLNILILFT